MKLVNVPKICMVFFQVKVDGKIKAIYAEIPPVLETTKFHLENGKTVTIEPVYMTADEFLEATDKL